MTDDEERSLGAPVANGCGTAVAIVLLVATCYALLVMLGMFLMARGDRDLGGPSASATSAPPYPGGELVPLDEPRAAVTTWQGDLIACVTADADGHLQGCSRLNRFTGDWFSLSAEQEKRRGDGALGTDPGTITACLPSQPQACYRVLPDALGVESTADGGATWTPEWTAVAADIETRLGLPAGSARSVEIALAEADGQFVVAVANGGAGLAFLDRDGIWHLGPLAVPTVSAP